MGGDQVSILHEVRGLLEPFNKNGIELTSSTDIATDLNVDSVAVMDLIMTIEDKYNISIPINMLSEVRSIGDLVQAIENVIGGE